jgi:hypothetical protein
LPPAGFFSPPETASARFDRHSKKIPFPRRAERGFYFNGGYFLGVSGAAGAGVSGALVAIGVAGADSAPIIPGAHFMPAQRPAQKPAAPPANSSTSAKRMILPLPPQQRQFGPQAQPFESLLS